MADTNLLILAREFKALRTRVQEVLKMPVGPQGLQGEKGEQGVKGETGAPGKNGKDGKDGVNGLNGSNGINGKDGIDGQEGKQGISVVDAKIDFDGSLVLYLSNGSEISAGEVTPAQAENVYAMLKNGAASLNELLPSQTGNSGKYLITNGSDVSWEFSSSGSIPVYMEANEVFTVSKNKQALFTREIQMEAGAVIVFEQRSVLLEVT